MTYSPAPPTPGGSWSPGRGILLAGLVAGSLDLIYAVVALGWRGRSPLWVLQSVASGLLGESAFTGGFGSGFLGLLCHFVVAFGAAATYALAAGRTPVLNRRPWVAGAVFGVLVYCFMNFVVIPLSAYPFGTSYSPRRVLEGFLFHALLVGIPIALIVRRPAFSKAKPDLARATAGPPV